MTDAASADDTRKALLATVKGLAGPTGGEGFAREYAIKQTIEKLGQRYHSLTARRVMDAWDDLYRTGAVGYGMDMANLGTNWAHLTEFGLASVKELDRDPANPAGFMAAVGQFLANEPVAASYLGEALATYNKGAFKSSAVMLGGAAEALHLSLRDKLAAKITTSGGTAPPELTTWIISRVLASMERLFGNRMNDMDRNLRERFESYWPAWTGLFRMTRNEAGHPKSVDPITRDAIHAALLLFPEQARLSADLAAWVDSTY